MKISCNHKCGIHQISIKKMASKLFEGWRIEYEGKTCGKIKFIPKSDHFFKKHVTVDFQIQSSLRGKHIGRIALNKAISSSTHSLFVAHLRKSNLPSKKALEAAGFQEIKHPESKQLCMYLKKLGRN